jgi:methionyl aminopeptidase
MNSYISQKITAMREGGFRLREVKKKLQNFVQVGTTFESIEEKAQGLIKAAGGVSNFALVPGYHWATCVMKNDELCHGIPKNKVVEDGDIITIDVGMLYKDWHLDTSISFGVGSVSKEHERFLEVGQKSLDKAINLVKSGVSVYEISHAMQKVVERAGYSAAYQLTGHAIGEKLHMEPSIPCVAQRSDKRVFLEAGDTIAIEIMYAKDDAFVILDKDKWTYRTEDGSVTAMFEETVLVTETGYEILT